MNLFKKITLLTLLITLCATTTTYAYPANQEETTLNPSHFDDENTEKNEKF